jgi:hypothetical protein
MNKFNDGSGDYYIRFTVTEANARPPKTGDNLIHSTAISDVEVYSEGNTNGGPRSAPALTASDKVGQPPFIDTRLQQFFDSVNTQNSGESSGDSILKAPASHDHAPQQGSNTTDAGLYDDSVTQRGNGVKRENSGNSDGDEGPGRAGEPGRTRRSAPTSDGGETYSLSDNIGTSDAIGDKAKKHFGTTNNWEITGYLLKDGTQLDFSGKHQGNPRPTSREVDHRDIDEAYTAADGTFGYKGEMIDFINRGNIRVAPEIGGIDLSVLPTPKQFIALDKYFDEHNGEIIVDYMRENGSAVGSTEYPKYTKNARIENDIKRYFETGTVPAAPAAMFSLSDAEATENKRTVAAMQPVAQLTGDEFAKSAISLDKQVDSYFKGLGYTVNNSDIGVITIDRRGAKDSLSHGIGRKKAAAFAAVPNVLSVGRVVSESENWKGRNYDSFIIAAPITISGKPHFMGAVVIKNENNQRFYLHEVALDNGTTLPFKTGTTANDSGAPGGQSRSALSRVLQELWNVKDRLVLSRIS